MGLWDIFVISLSFIAVLCQFAVIATIVSIAWDTATEPKKVDWQSPYDEDYPEPCTFCGYPGCRDNHNS